MLAFLHCTHYPSQDGWPGVLIYELFKGSCLQYWNAWLRWTRSTLSGADAIGHAGARAPHFWKLLGTGAPFCGWKLQNFQFFSGEGVVSRDTWEQQWVSRDWIVSLYSTVISTKRTNWIWMTLHERSCVPAVTAEMYLETSHDDTQ